MCAGGVVMMTFPSQTKIYLFHNPVSFGCGLEGMLRYCRALVGFELVERGYFMFISKSLKMMSSIMRMIPISNNNNSSSSIYKFIGVYRPNSNLHFINKIHRSINFRWITIINLFSNKIKLNSNSSSSR